MVRNEQRDNVQMEVDEEVEYENMQPMTEENVLREETEIEIPHQQYLETCFRRQIGLSIDKPQKMDIFTFTKKRVAKGYQQIVTTCQGMYYEMRWEHVDWGQWKNKRTTVGGDWCSASA